MSVWYFEVGDVSVDCTVEVCELLLCVVVPVTDGVEILGKVAVK